MKHTLMKGWALALALGAACVPGPADDTQGAGEGGSEVRTGYVMGFHGKPVRIRYTEVEGQAMQGDMAFGPVEAIAPTREEALRRAAGGSVSSQSAGQGVDAMVMYTSGQLWPGGTVYYQWDAALVDDPRKALQQAIDYLNSRTAETGVRLVEGENGGKFVRLKPGSDWAEVGYLGREQVLKFNNTLWQVGVHELGHTIGLWHEHQRCNQADFLYIHTPDDPDIAANCEQPTVPNEPYDTSSVMHYSVVEFKGRASFMPGVPVAPAKGAHEGLSPYDVRNLAFLYLSGQQGGQHQPLPPSTYPPNWNFAEGNTDLDVSLSPQLYALGDTQPQDSAPFFVPDTTQSLRFEYFARDDRDGSWPGTLLVEVLSGTSYATVTRIDGGQVTGTGLEGWKKAVLDLQRFRGQAIKLRFRNWDWPGRGSVQNLSLHLETPRWTPSSAPHVQIRRGDAPSGIGAYVELREAHGATSQPFTIPAEAQSLRFDFQTGDSRDGHSLGALLVEVLSGDGLTTVERIDGNTTLGTLNQGWKTAVLDVQKFRGVTIKLRFRNWDWPGLTRISGVTLNVETPGWVPGDSKVVRLSAAEAPADPGVTAPLNPTFEPSAVKVHGCVPNCDFSLGDTPLAFQVSPATYALEGTAAQESTAFEVPATAQALRFEYLAGDSRDGNFQGNLHVSVLGGGGFAIVTRIDGGAVQGTHNQGWKVAVLDVQQFQGRTVKLRFANWDWPGRSSVKNLSFRQVTPRWVPSSASSVHIKANGDGLSGGGAYAELNGSTSLTSEAFTVLAIAQSLRFDYLASDSRDGNSTGTLLVEVLGGADFSKVTRIDADLVRGTRNEGWKKAALNLQAFQGQTVKLRFRNWDWPGRSLLDNVLLKVELEGWTSSNIPAASVDAALEPADSTLLTPPNGSFALTPGASSFYNGDFSQPGAPLSTTITPASYAFTSTTSVESDAFLVPGSAQSLRFEYQAGDFRDSTYPGTLLVYVLSGPDFATLTRIDEDRVKGTTSQGWKSAVLDLQKFQGQAVKLRFRNWDWPGAGKVQGLSMNIETHGWTPSHVPSVQVLQDGNGHPGSGAYLQLDGSHSATTGALAVPKGTQGLRFDYQTGDSRSGTSNGALRVEVLSGEDFAVTTRIDENLVEGTLNQGWKKALLDLQKFRGQTVKLRFTNGDWPVRSRIDNILLSGETPSWTPSATPRVHLLNDENSLPTGGTYLHLTGSESVTSAPFRVSAAAKDLRFDYMTGDSRGTTLNGALLVEVLSGPDYSLVTRIDRSLLEGSLSQGWKQGVLDLKTFRGRTVKVRFRNWDWPGKTRLDNITVEHDVSSGTTFAPAPTGSATHLLLTGGHSVTSAPFKVGADTTSLRFDFMAGDFRDGNNNGALHVYVLSGPDFSVSTRIDGGLTQGTLNQGWKSRTLDLTGFRGRTVQLRFQNWDWPGRTLLDNLTFVGGATGPLPSENDENPAPSYVTVSGASYVTSEAFTVTAGNATRSIHYLTGDSRDGAWTGTLHIEVVTHPYAISGTRVDNNQFSGRLIDGWKQGTVDLSSYTGQSIRLRFLNWDWPGSTRVAFTP